MGRRILSEGHSGRKKADAAPVTGESKASELERLREEMQQAAKELRFEEAAYLRDKIRALEATK